MEAGDKLQPPSDIIQHREPPRVDTTVECGKWGQIYTPN